MNKTISINLGGSVFNIEEDAFKALKHYLDTIKAKFAGDPAQQEIMQDIEVRIAEIFHEKNNERKNVIVYSDVDEMIHVMGKPEDYKMEDEQPSGGAEYAQGGSMRHNKRKVYRDTDDAIIAGVCSGLSHYLGWDPLVLRLIWVILTVVSVGFPGVIIYILFWALVPEARSTAEKLHMRGETVNIENIGRFVNEEAKAAGERVNRFGKNVSQSFNSGSRDLLNASGRVIAVIFGIIIIMMGLGLLAGLVAMLTFSDIDFFGFDGNNWDTMNTVIFANDGTLYFLITGIVLAMGAPAIGLLYFGTRLITGTSRRIKALGGSLVALFVIGVLLLVYSGIKTGREFTQNADITQSFTLPAESSDTLRIDVLPDDIFIGRSPHHNDFSNLVKISGDSVYYGVPVNIQVQEARGENFRVIIRKQSQGKHLDDAGNRAHNIDYFANLQGDSLLLAPYFRTPKSDLYRGQHVDIEVQVPQGKFVHFGKNSGYLSWYNEDALVRMTEDGPEEE